jgi:hypothetical protein
MATPIAPFVFGGLGALALLRALWRPHRAVLRKGSVDRCSGPNRFGVCDPTMGLTADDGTEAYAVASGKVAAVGDQFVHVVGRQEPVILVYQGIVPAVVEGQHVGKGQKIGEVAGPVAFGVWQLRPTDTGPVLQVVPPSAWMAARGIRPTVKHGDANKWCEGGRTIVVPSETRRSCDMKKPDPASFALLPVQIDLEA